MPKEIKKCIIPVAGYGSRLFPATITTSKTLLPLGNKPALSYLLEECMFAGLKEIILIISPEQVDVVKYLSLEHLDTLLKVFPTNKDLLAHKALIEYFDAIKFHVQLHPDGLGNAIYLAKAYLENDEDVAVILGDNPAIDNCGKGIIELIKKYRENPKASYIGLKKIPVEDHCKYGMVSLNFDRDKLITGLLEKPQNMPCSDYAIFGRYILKYDVFDHIKYQKKYHKNKELNLTTPLSDYLYEHGKIYGVILEADILDTGNPVDYAKAFEKAMKGIN